jgi:hypothetical protein
MAILEDLKAAVTSAISAGADAARKQGTVLTADYNNQLLPNFDAVLIQIASITDDVVAQNITPTQAIPDFTTQFDCIPPLILAEAELVLLGVQVITNAVMDALKGVVNSAIGVALL